VRDAAAAALEQARTDGRPALLEVMTYRLKGHSVVDPARYRSTEDTEEAKRADPLPALRKRLIDAKVFSEDEAAAIDAEAESTVKEAVAFADDSPDPTPDDLFAFAYATAVANAPHTLPGEPLLTEEAS